MRVGKRELQNSVELDTGFRRCSEIMTAVAILDKPFKAIAKPMIALAENPLSLYS